MSRLPPLALAIALALSPVFPAAAAEGDPAAAAVVERSAQALARMVATIGQRLALGNPPVGPLGGALEHLELLRQRFAAALALHCPGARLEQAAGDGCSGALALARLCLEP